MTRPRRGYVDFNLPRQYWKKNRDLTYIEASMMYLLIEQNMKPAEIARKLDRKLSTVTTQLNRIKRRRNQNDRIKTV